MNGGGWQVERVAWLTLNEFCRVKELTATLLTVTSVTERVTSDSQEAID